MFRESKMAVGPVKLNVAQGPPHGPPLLLLHGVTRTWRDFHALLPALSLRHTVWAVDLRGHAGSGWDGQGRYAVDDFAADVIELVRGYLGEPPIVFGHSLGSLVAARVAAQVPVRAVILEDLPCALLHEHWDRSGFREMYFTWAEWARQGLDPAGWLDRLSHQLVALPGQDERVPLASLRDPAALRFSASWIARMDPRVLQALLDQQWGSQQSLGQTLRKISRPTLVLQGNWQRGGMCDDHSAEDLRPLLADGCWVRLEECGHLIHQLATETTLRLVGSFLESLQ